MLKSSHTWTDIANVVIQKCLTRYWGREKSAGHCCRASLAGETVVLTHLCVLIMEKRAFGIRQGAGILLPVSIAFSCAHQSLFLSNLFLLEDFPHEVPFVHRGSDDFQVVCVDNYLPKVYNRWRLEKQRVSTVTKLRVSEPAPCPFQDTGEEGFAPIQTVPHPTPKLPPMVHLFFLKVRRVTFLLAEDGNRGRLSHSEGETRSQGLEHLFPLYPRTASAELGT